MHSDSIFLDPIVSHSLSIVDDSAAFELGLKESKRCVPLEFQKLKLMNRLLIARTKDSDVYVHPDPGYPFYSRQCSQSNHTKTN